MNRVYNLAATAPRVLISTILYDRLICFILLLNSPAIVISLFVLIVTGAVLGIIYFMILIQLINYSERVDQVFRCT